MARNARNQNGPTGHHFKGLKPVHTHLLSDSFLHERHGGNGQCGVSLFEALIVLSVVATLTVIGIPSFRDLLARTEQVTAMNTLITALHFARSEAIKRVMRVALCPSLDGHQCVDAGANGAEWHGGYLVYVDHNGNRAPDNDEPVLRHFGTQTHIHIYSTESRDHITYRPNGLASGTNATFLFCDPTGTVPPRKVILSNTGRPRVAPSTVGCPAGRK